MDPARIDVRDFGARGDFVTDDTAAIQSAINSAHERAVVPGGRRAIYLPGGDYLVGPLRLSGNIALVGDGTATSRLFSRDKGQTTLSLTGIAENTSAIRMRGLGFFANERGGTGLHLAGRDADTRIIEIRIEDCQFSLFAEAMRLRLCTNVWLGEVHASACNTGIVIDTSSDVKLSRCFADNGSGWAYYVTDDGAHGASGEGVYLMNCVSNAQAAGLLVENQSWGHAIGCSFTSSSTNAVVLDGAGNWRISQGEMATASEGRGLVLSPAASKCIVEGNYIALCNGAIVAGGSDHLIANNLLDAGIGAQPDIEIQGTACKVSGNKCLSMASRFSIQETGEANFNYITGNMMQGQIAKIGRGSVVAADQFHY